MDRFWNKVNKTETCWLWTSGTSPLGYGRFWADGAGIMAHRWAYQDRHGPIPAGLELDHLCRVRHCVNPSHLEAVTHTENVRRGNGGRKPSAMCPQKHEMSGTNVYIRPNGYQDCRACRRDRARARRV